MLNSLENRLLDLRQLHRFLVEQQDSLLLALQSDLGRPDMDSYMAELYQLHHEVLFALRNLRRWTSPRKHSGPGIHWPAQVQSQWVPRGRVLILAPWNYPLFLSLSPVISALAAGNTIVLKPSELAPETSRILSQRLPAYFAPGRLTVNLGDAGVARTLLQEKWDLVFFTGSRSVGQAVYQDSARTFSPCVLELGGKNPVIAERGVASRILADRIVWGKFLNAGQTCLAPDHLWVPAADLEEWLGLLKDSCSRMFQGDWSTLRLANNRQVKRLEALWAESQLQGETKIWQHALQGGGGWAAVLAVDFEHSPWAQEEIFAPVLPVFCYTDPQQVLGKTKTWGEPLALYSMGKTAEFHEFWQKQIPAGTSVRNGVLTQILSTDAPLGGVGLSGMGLSRGQAGFEQFSHCQTQGVRNRFIDLRMGYPPYRWSLSTLRRWLFRLR